MHLEQCEKIPRSCFALGMVAVSLSLSPLVDQAQVFDVYFPVGYPNGPPEVKLLTTGMQLSKKSGQQVWTPSQNSS